jgi:hypothetical protein
MTYRPGLSVLSYSVQNVYEVSLKFLHALRNKLDKVGRRHTCRPSDRLPGVNCTTTRFSNGHKKGKNTQIKHEATENEQ